MNKSHSRQSPSWLIGIFFLSLMSVVPPINYIFQPYWTTIIVPHDSVLLLDIALPSFGIPSPHSAFSTWQTQLQKFSSRCWIWLPMLHSRPFLFIYTYVCVCIWGFFGFVFYVNGHSANIYLNISSSYLWVCGNSGASFLTFAFLFWVLNMQTFCNNN